MPVAKTRPSRNAKTSALKRARKVRPEDVWAIINDIAQMQKESHEEWKAARRETEKTLKEARIESEKEWKEARRETEKALREARMESEKEWKEARRETEKALKEARMESEKEWKEALAESEKARKKSEQRLDEAMGRLGNKLGDIAEYTLIPGLSEKFKAWGLFFDRTNQNVQLDDRTHDLYAQIDALLENGVCAMVVEVKVTLRPGDVDDHIRRMEKVRRYADLRGDSRRFYGAIAAMVVDRDCEAYALRQGFYVIEPSGEDVKITPPVSRAKAW